MIAHWGRYSEDYSTLPTYRVKYVSVDWAVSSSTTDRYRSQIRRNYPADDWVTVPLARCPVCKCLTPQVIAIKTGMRICVVCEEVVYQEKHTDGLPKKAPAAPKAARAEDNEREIRDFSGLAARPPPRSV